MTGVLDGIRVIDLAQGWAGPATAMLLADQGAEVIKVEPPGGDVARGWYPSPALPDASRSFVALNRNKRSIVVDLTQEAGKEIVRRLATAADVAVVNARPQTARRLGIDYETFAVSNPRLVYAAVSGYGERGPYAGQPAFDPIIQGLTGAMDRWLPDGVPVRAGVWVADMALPMLLAYGVTLALLARERTGRGQAVTSSLLEAAVALQSPDLVYVPADPMLPSSSLVASGVYRCSDGRHINVAALTEKQVVALCNVLGCPHLLEDPWFLDPASDHTQAQRQWRTELGAAFARRPADEWLALLRAAEVPCGPVLRRQEVFSEPQIVESAVFITQEDRQAGGIQTAGIPVHLAAHPGSIRRPAPVLGQHTDEVLSELGYTPDQIATLRRRRAAA